MSTMVLDRAQQAEKLEAFIGGFQKVVKETNTYELKQKKINKFLDSILIRQEYLAERNAEFAENMPGFAEFFWYTQPDEDMLASLKTLVGLMHEVSFLMQDAYHHMNEFFYKNKLSRVALHQYREYSNQLKEAAIDLEHRFFTLPVDEEFMDIMQQLDDL